MGPAHFLRSLLGVVLVDVPRWKIAALLCPLKLTCLCEVIAYIP